MAPENRRALRDREIRIVATATVSIFGSVLGFVLAMTIMGVDPWEAVGVAIAAGTVTGTIVRLLHDLLGPRPPQAEPSADIVLPEPTEDGG